jgi:hypothetical protein
MRCQRKVMRTHRRLFAATLMTAFVISVVPAFSAELDPKAISFTLPDKLNWRKGPISDSVMLQGDSSRPGIYIQLMRWHRNNMSRPHSHDTARYITVISGTWWVGTGDKFDPDSTTPMPAGSYVVDIPNELHYDGAKDEECVLVIVGMGPMKTLGAVNPGPLK